MVLPLPRLDAMLCQHGRCAQAATLAQLKATFVIRSPSTGCLKVIRCESPTVDACANGLTYCHQAKDCRKLVRKSWLLCSPASWPVAYCAALLLSGCAAVGLTKHAVHAVVSACT